MKFRLTKKQNAADGNDLYCVYKLVADKWVYVHAASSEQAARDYIVRAMNPPDEELIAEFGE